MKNLQLLKKIENTLNDKAHSFLSYSSLTEEALKIAVRAKNTKQPIITPVMGSNVLRMEARSPPMIKVLCWNSTTAPVVTNRENKAHNPQIAVVVGNTSWRVARQSTKEPILLITAT